MQIRIPLRVTDCHNEAKNYKQEKQQNDQIVGLLIHLKFKIKFITYKYRYKDDEKTWKTSKHTHMRLQSSYPMIN